MFWFSSESEPEEPDETIDFEFEIATDKNFLQGQTLAVFYDNCFYIGQVLNEKSANESEIAFMQQVHTKNLFRWGLEDIDAVSKLYVWLWNVKLSSRNERTWSVDNLRQVGHAYEAYKTKYCRWDSKKWRCDVPNAMIQHASNICKLVWLSFDEFALEVRFWR